MSLLQGGRSRYANISIDQHGEVILKRSLGNVALI